jgi:HEAT repeat protein
MKRNLLFTNFVFAYFFAALSMWPQEMHYHHGPPASDMDDQTLLEKYQIPATKEGWLAALQNSEPLVRVYAAHKLATGRYADAVQPILAALAKEMLPGDAVILAYAAARLGADDGYKALNRMCQAPNWDAGLRMTAARTMLYLGRSDCLPSVLNVLQRSADDQATVLALNLMPLFTQLTADQMEEVKTLLSTSLENSSTAVRSEACYALHQFGVPWAIERLRSALAVETDESVRNVIASYLAHPISR